MPQAGTSRRGTLRWLLAPLAAAGALACGGRSWAGGEPPALRLPHDPEAVILRWDSLGGLRRAGDDDTAVIVLHASGRYTAAPAQPGGPRTQGRLSPAQLRALLHDVVHTHGFAGIRGDEITARVRQAQQAAEGEFMLPGRDAPTTRIALVLPALQHTVELHDLSGLRARHPGIEPLRRLHALQQQLLHLAASAR